MRWVAVILLISACTSVRPYKKVAADARVTIEKKAIIAPFVSTHFPPIYRTVRDTVRITDTTYNGKLMYELYKTIEVLSNTPAKENPELRKKLDSLIKECSRTVNTVITVNDTIYVTDAAKDMALSHFISSLQYENGLAKKDVEEQKVRAGSAVKKMRWYMVGMYAAIALALMFLILLFKR